MERPHLLHMITPDANVSPFDVNMAYDAGFDAVIPYTHVAVKDVRGLDQDMIFSRSANDVKRTALFISGRDASLALEAAIEGMGVTLAMKPLVRSEIEARRLVVPFDIAAPTAYSYYLVTPETGAASPSVAAFREWLLESVAPERA